MAITEDAYETSETGQAMIYAAALAPGRPSVESEFHLDHNGNPKGGYSHGPGFSVSWQNGLGAPGATMEEVLESNCQRLRFFQSGKFACQENADALLHIEAAIRRLNDRTRERQSRGVEGTYSV